MRVLIGPHDIAPFSLQQDGSGTEDYDIDQFCEWVFSGNGFLTFTSFDTEVRHGHNAHDIMRCAVLSAVAPFPSVIVVMRCLSHCARQCSPTICLLMVNVRSAVWLGLRGCVRQGREVDRFIYRQRCLRTYARSGFFSRCEWLPQGRIPF